MVQAFLHMGASTTELDVTPVPDVPFTYEVQFTQSELVVAILEFRIDNVEVVKSPVLVEVLLRQCENEFQGKSSVTSGVGKAT